MRRAVTEPPDGAPEVPHDLRGVAGPGPFPSCMNPAPRVSPGPRARCQRPLVPAHPSPRPRGRARSLGFVSRFSKPREARGARGAPARGSAGAGPGPCVPLRGPGSSGLRPGSRVTERRPGGLRSTARGAGRAALRDPRGGSGAPGGGPLTENDPGRRSAPLTPRSEGLSLSRECR